MENTDRERVTTYIPAEVKRQLEESAKVNRRSLASEVCLRLERSTEPQSQARRA